jgi:hypothetical protein
MGYRFTDDDDVNFRVQTMLGGVIYGLGDVGEILQAVSTVAGRDDRAWSSAFAALGKRIEGVAETARTAGNTRSAREAYLRAAVYYAAQQDAELAYADDDILLATFRDHRRCWDAFAQLNEPALEQVAIPYEDSTLPGYFLSVDGTERPTIVIINGSDGPVTWVWTLAQACQDHGFNALMFDGPGQQSMLFERKVPFRPDWEHVITPVVDHLSRRSDVDTDSLVLWGGSQGGYWAPRALAFEKRFAAGVFDPGVVDVGQSWLTHLPPELIQLLDSGDQKDFDDAINSGLTDPQTKAVWNFRARPYGTFEPFEVYSAIREYDLADVAGRITTPVMICDPEGEQFWPGQSEQLAGMVGGPSTLVKFTADEGADMHCEPMARSLVHQRMFDWLATVLPPK